MTSQVIIPEVPELFFQALAVWSGYYGNGHDRVTALTNDGYDAEKVQAVVNKLVNLFDYCKELEEV